MMCLSVDICGYVCMCVYIVCVFQRSSLTGKKNVLVYMKAI